MKNFKTIRTTFLASVLLCLGLTSCNDDDVATVVTPPTIVDNTIAARAIANPNLTILVAALTKTNLVATLQSTGPFTVFAPTDVAFTAAGVSVASINASTPAQVASLKEILLNHVISGSKTAAQLTNNEYLRTLSTGLASATNKLSMHVSKVGAVVKLNNNAVVTAADVSASNGVIHVVDKVITAPTIVDLVAANTDFSSLVGNLSTNLVATLKTTGPFTVFAPNNPAFASLTTELAAIPLVPNPTQLENVLKYHVVNGNYLESALSTVVAAGPTSTLLASQTFTVALTPARITGTYSPTRMASKITATDIQANNGVIHVLDKVLLPATF